MALLRTVLAGTILAAALAPFVSPDPVHAQRLTQDEALELAFPGADFQRETAFLDDGQVAEVTELAGREAALETTIITHYVGCRDGRPEGVVYFDAHTVRTVDEVLMIVVEPGPRVRRVETVSFREPPEYEAPDGWLRLFDGRGLDDDLQTRRGIPNITGATLTADAVTRAVRRTLALHRVLDPLGEGGSCR